MTRRHASRSILHVDMDAFFASVEVLDEPSLKGKPVIVGGSVDRRGVVAAASYEARAFGVHSAMPAAEAHRLCPHAVFLPARHDRYAEISRKVMAVFGTFTPLVEEMSVDEAWLDVTGTEGLFGAAPALARTLKTRVRESTGLTCSVGVAPNKFLAKLASDLEKPDGLTVVPEDAARFLAPLPVSRIPGVGPKTAESLAAIGLRTIGELAAAPPGLLTRRLGSYAGELQALARGKDERPVVTGREAKGMSRETTFAEFLETPDEADTALLALADDVAARLREDGLTGRTVTLKVRDEKFLTRTRSRTLTDPADLGDILYDVAAELLHEVDLGGKRIRLLGVGVDGLIPAGTGQMSLLPDPRSVKLRRLAGAVDKVRSRHGESSVVRARLLKTDPLSERAGWEGAPKSRG